MGKYISWEASSNDTDFLILVILISVPLNQIKQLNSSFFLPLFLFFILFYFSPKCSIYQIRGHLRTSPKIAVKLEGALYENNTNLANGTTGANASASILHPACVANGSFISQTFQILYRNEDVPLFDMAQFRLHVLVDSHKVSLTVRPALKRKPEWTITFSWFHPVLLPRLKRCWRGSTSNWSSNCGSPIKAIVVAATSRIVSRTAAVTVATEEAFFVYPAALCDCISHRPAGCTIICPFSSTISIWQLSLSPSMHRWSLFTSHTSSNHSLVSISESLRRNDFDLNLDRVVLAQHSLHIKRIGEEYVKNPIRFDHSALNESFNWIPNDYVDLVGSLHFPHSELQLELIIDLDSELCAMLARFPFFFFCSLLFSQWFSDLVVHPYHISWSTIKYSKQPFYWFISIIAVVPRNWIWFSANWLSFFKALARRSTLRGRTRNRINWKKKAIRACRSLIFLLLLLFLAGSTGERRSFWSESLKCDIVAVSRFPLPARKKIHTCSFVVYSVRVDLSLFIRHYWEAPAGLIILRVTPASLIFLRRRKPPLLCISVCTPLFFLSAAAIGKRVPRTIRPRHSYH